MRIIIESRNEFYDGWLAEVLQIPVPKVGRFDGFESGKQTAAESGEPCLLLQALRLELSQGTRNLQVTFVPPDPQPTDGEEGVMAKEVKRRNCIPKKLLWKENEQLRAENQRMKAVVDVARKYLDEFEFTGYNDLDSAVCKYDNPQPSGDGEVSGD